MEQAAIETTGLRKRYGSLPVLDGLTLRVEHGDVFALLGPNGAGKSTLIHLLLGFIRPDAGEIRVLGQPPGRASRIGYLPERVRYHPHFAPREYLRHLGRLSDLRGRALAGRIDDVLALVAVVLHTALAVILLPATLGYTLAVSRVFGESWPLILGGQLALVAVVLAAVLAALRRRDLILA